MSDGWDIPKIADTRAGIPERATNGVLVKFTTAELAALDRLAARLGHKRTVAIKRLIAAAVLRSDEEQGE